MKTLPSFIVTYFYIFRFPDISRHFPTYPDISRHFPPIFDISRPTFFAGMSGKMRDNLWGGPSWLSISLCPQMARNNNEWSVSLSRLTITLPKITRVSVTTSLLILLVMRYVNECAKLANFCSRLFQHQPQGHGFVSSFSLIFFVNDKIMFIF